MKYQIATLAALAGSSYAALEAYAPAGYGTESSSTVPAAPAYETTSSAPAAPVYGASSSTSSVPSAPVYGASSSTTEEAATTVTDVISTYVTYCPEATTLTHGGSTYT